MPVTLPISGTEEYLNIDPSKIIAVGMNYHAHIKESESVRVKGMTGEVPEEPVLFAKTPNVLIGPGDDIPLPIILKDYRWDTKPRTDYEGELVVIIGKSGRHILEENALEYVFGYTCGIDVSQRNIQNGDRSGWFRGKSFDGFGPVGPAVVPGTSISPQNLNLETRLNGRRVQSANTSQMIFSIPYLLAFISRQMTLEKGDLIFTGTPAGVGPIKEGDVVDVEIEGIGVLSCPVVTEKDPV